MALSCFELGEFAVGGDETGYARAKPPPAPQRHRYLLRNVIVWFFPGRSFLWNPRVKFSGYNASSRKKVLGDVLHGAKHFFSREATSSTNSNFDETFNMLPGTNCPANYGELFVGGGALPSIRSSDTLGVQVNLRVLISTRVFFCMFDPQTSLRDRCAAETPAALSAAHLPHL